jgi:hypothetical protein
VPKTGASAQISQEVDLEAIRIWPRADACNLRTALDGILSANRVILAGQVIIHRSHEPPTGTTRPVISREPREVQLFRLLIIDSDAGRKAPLSGCQPTSRDEPSVKIAYEDAELAGLTAPFFWVAPGRHSSRRKFGVGLGGVSMGVLLPQPDTVLRVKAKRRGPRRQTCNLHRESGRQLILCRCNLREEV